MKAKKIAACMLSIAMLMTSTMPAFATVAGNEPESDIILESSDTDELAGLLAATGSNTIKDEQQKDDFPENSDIEEPEDLLIATGSNTIQSDQTSNDSEPVKNDPDLTDMNQGKEGADTAADEFDVEIEEYIEIEDYIDTEDMLENDELAAGFIEKLMYQYEDVSFFGNYGENSFDPFVSYIYQGVKQAVTDIAYGRSNDPTIVIYVNKQWTEDELGITNLENLEKGSPELQQLFSVTIDTYIDISRHLLVNSPYEFYWYDKTKGFGAGAALDYEIITVDGEPCVETEGYVVMQFSVSQAYQDGNGGINTDKIQSAIQAAENANTYVIDDSSLSDYEKIVEYKNLICELVKYNENLTSAASYGDPWQIVYVFDEDPDTDVVCEGYSKAFQYLCDMSGITCYTISGVYQRGDFRVAHMWNMVTLEGKNYLVDITNCDGEDTIGYPDKLFVTGAAGSVESGYTVSFMVKDETPVSVFYTYDDSTKSMYSKDILTLSSRPYSMEQSNIHIESQPGKEVVAIPGREVALTVKAEGADSCQWYYKAADDAEPILIVPTSSNAIVVKRNDGKIESTLTFDMTTDKLEYQYMCMLSGEENQDKRTDWIRLVDTGWKKDGDTWYRYEDGEMLTSTFFTVTENAKNRTYYANADGKLAIGFIEQPKDQNGSNGETVKFTVEVSEVLEEERTYQWYYSADGGVNWKKAADDDNYHGAKSSAFEVKASNYQRTLQFRCEIGAEGYDTVTSDVVKIVGTNDEETGSNDSTDSSDSTGSNDSTSSNDQSGMMGIGSAGTSKPATETEVFVAANGTTVSTTGSTKDKSGTVIGLVVGHKTPAGETAVSNGNGGVKLGNVSIHFADGAAETAGLPKDVVDKIEKLNRSDSVSEVLGTVTGVDLSLYSKLGNTRAVIAYDHTTQLTNTGTEILLHVSIVDGAEMAAVYYDNNTGRWVFVPVIVDPVTKTVKVLVPGSCTLQLLKKN